MNYKGKYRILPEIDVGKNDFPRDFKGRIVDTDIYIACQNGNKIMTYGHINGKRMVWLIAYISSIGRARNIKKSLDELGIEYRDYTENDIEADFKFKSSDIDTVAKLMKAKTGGANISPFSVKNLPQSVYTIENIDDYKEIRDSVKKEDLLIISQITNRFISEIMQKKYRHIQLKGDIKKKCMSRQLKEYIHSMGEWNSYLKYLKDEINKFYASKGETRDA